MRSRSAMTLVEVLVAMMVLGVGLVSVMTAFSTCARALGYIRGETVAANFAANMLAEMRENPSLLLSGDSGDVGEDHPGFTWQRELRESSQPGVLAATVTVRWTSQGVEQEYALSSLVESAGR